jgi:hypothetical protein
MTRKQPLPPTYLCWDPQRPSVIIPIEEDCTAKEAARQAAIELASDSTSDSDLDVVVERQATATTPAKRYCFEAYVEWAPTVDLCRRTDDFLEDLKNASQDAKKEGS